jgi:hypothetical protein
MSTEKTINEAPRNATPEIVLVRDLLVQVGHGGGVVGFHVP